MARNRLAPDRRALVAGGLAILAGVVGEPARGAPRPAESGVTVRFVDPERYTDAGNRFDSGPGLRVTLAEIERILRAAALRAMTPGDALTVDILDIDLAGFPNPGLNPPSGVRVVSDVTPPAFRLRYDLRRGRRSIAAGEERVSDINFLFGARAAPQGSFAYEDALLRDWARRRLANR